MHMSKAPARHEWATRVIAVTLCAFIYLLTKTESENAF